MSVYEAGPFRLHAERLVLMHGNTMVPEYWRETLDMAPSLAQRPNLPAYPTWASIENTVD